MDEAESNIASTSKTPKEHLFQGGFKRSSPNSFGTAVRAIWPDKPALNLAQRMGVTERNALQIINGERRVTAQAIHVLNAEFLPIPEAVGTARKAPGANL